MLQGRVLFYYKIIMVRQKYLKLHVISYKIVIFLIVYCFYFLDILPLNFGKHSSIAVVGPNAMATDVMQGNYKVS